MKKNILIFPIICMAYVKSTYGQSVITFDEFPTSGSHTITQITNGYAGLSWNNFSVINTIIPSGYINGSVSAPNVAFNVNENPASFSSATPFALISGYFTAAWNNGLSLEVIGINGTTTEYDNTYILNTSGPLLIDFPTSLVTEVDFNASGGVNAGYQGTGTEFVLDNLTVSAVPEPSTVMILSVGFGSLFWVGRKQMEQKRCLM